MAKKKQKKPAVKKQRVKNTAPVIKTTQALKKGFTIPEGMLG